MHKNLLIIFAKNKLPGKVKTRLAKTIGEKLAFEVYEALYHITERESLAVSGADIHVYYSHEIDENAWGNCTKFIQCEGDLGIRMKTAFAAGFAAGYERIVGIGADLPEITASIIQNAFSALHTSNFVFGPAEDGGYYLVGMANVKGLYIFENKPWSTSNLLRLTQQEIAQQGNTFYVLETLNDIDTVEDLKKSPFGKQFENAINQALEQN